MGLCRRLSGLFFIVFTVTSVHGSEAIRHIASSDENDPQKSYFVALLNKACIESEDLYGPCNLVPVYLPMYQERQLKSLNSEVLDVVWTASTPDREVEAKAVKTPLMNGLLGFRVAIHNTKLSAYFQKNSSLKQLRKLRLVQGHDWPDVDILRHNGFEVFETSWYDTLYSDTSKNVFDFVLRGALEAIPEFEKHQQANLEIDKNHLFVDPKSIYFFVKKENTPLHDRLAYGLEKLNKSGELRRFLISYPSHSKSLQLLDFSNRRVHSLRNLDGEKYSAEEIKQKLAYFEL